MNLYSDNKYVIISAVESFSDLLNREMEIRGISQADIARGSGLARNTISNLVSGYRKPTPETIVAICNYLRLDPAYVMRQIGIMPPERTKINSITEEIIQLVERIPAPEQAHLLEIVRAYTKRYLPQK